MICCRAVFLKNAFKTPTPQSFFSLLWLLLSISIFSIRKFALVSSEGFNQFFRRFGRIVNRLKKPFGILLRQFDIFHEIHIQSLSFHVIHHRIFSCFLSTQYNELVSVPGKEVAWKEWVRKDRQRVEIGSAKIGKNCDLCGAVGSMDILYNSHTKPPSH